MRKASKPKHTKAGAEILAALQEIVDALESGEPLEKHFTVRVVEVPDKKESVKRARRVKARSELRR